MHVCVCLCVSDLLFAISLAHSLTQYQLDNMLCLMKEYTESAALSLLSLLHGCLEKGLFGPSNLPSPYQCLKIRKLQF